MSTASLPLYNDVAGTSHIGAPSIHLSREHSTPSSRGECPAIENLRPAEGASHAGALEAVLVTMPAFPADARVGYVGRRPHDQVPTYSSHVQPSLDHSWTPGSRLERQFEPRQPVYPPPAASQRVRKLPPMPWIYEVKRTSRTIIIVLVLLFRIAGGALVFSIGAVVAASPFVLLFAVVVASFAGIGASDVVVGNAICRMAGLAQFTSHNVAAKMGAVGGAISIAPIGLLAAISSLQVHAFFIFIVNSPFFFGALSGAIGRAVLLRVGFDLEGIDASSVTLAGFLGALVLCFCHFMAAPPVGVTIFCLSRFYLSIFRLCVQWLSEPVIANGQKLKVFCSETQWKDSWIDDDYEELIVKTSIA